MSGASIPLCLLQDTHLAYVEAAAHLLAHTYRLPSCGDRVATRDVLCHTVLPPFVPKDGRYVPTVEGVEEVEEALGKATARLCPQSLMKRHGPGAAAVITGSWPVPPASLEPGQLLELVQELARWKQELGGGTEAMDPIHYDKVPQLQGSGRWHCFPWDAHIPTLFPAGRRPPLELHHSCIQSARRELQHPACRPADGECRPRGSPSPQGGW